MDSLEQLISYLSNWSNTVKRLNNLFYTDKARYSEKFYAEVLSTTYSLCLNNLNLIKVNFPSVDLADFNKKVCFQISSTYSKDKIDHTIKLFFENKLNEKFERLIIFFICDDKNRSDLTQIKNSVSIEVLTLDRLFKDVESMSQGKQRTLLDLLKSEFDENVQIWERSFWISRMSHQYPVNIQLNTGKNTEQINTYFTSRLVSYSYSDEVRRLLNLLLRELTYNVYMHGEPTNQEIQVVINRQQIVFYDWGKGFNPRKLAFMHAPDPSKNYGVQLFKELKRRLRGRFNCKFILGEYGVRPNKTVFNFFEPLEALNLYEDCCIWKEEMGCKELYSGCATVYFLPDRIHNGSQSRDEYNYFRRNLKTGQKAGIALFEDDIDKKELLRRAFPDSEIKVVKKMRRR